MPELNKLNHDPGLREYVDLAMRYEGRLFALTCAQQPDGQKARGDEMCAKLRAKVETIESRVLAESDPDLDWLCAVLCRRVRGFKPEGHLRGEGEIASRLFWGAAAMDVEHAA